MEILAWFLFFELTEETTTMIKGANLRRGVAGASLLPRATAYSITWGSGVVALTLLDRPCKRQPRRGAGTDARLGRRPDPQGAKERLSPFSKFGRNRTSSAAKERGDSGDAAGTK